MPEISIRPVTAADLPLLIAIDHTSTTDYVWQMDIQQDELQVSVNFRQVRLPRSARVEYPRDHHSLADDWQKCSGLLVAAIGKDVVGYIRLELERAPLTGWATDLVVSRRLRRQGIGTALTMAAQEWCKEHGSYRMVLEMQPKNYPAICLAQKLGFDFCGYNDRYYINHDIAIFFSKAVR